MGTPPPASRLFAAAALTVSVTLDKLNNLKQKDKLPISKPKVPTVTPKPTKQERRQSSTFAPTTAGTSGSGCLFTPPPGRLLKLPFLFTQRAARSPGKTRSSSSRSRPPTSTLWERSDM